MKMHCDAGVNKKYAIIQVDYLKEYFEYSVVLKFLHIIKAGQR